MEYLQYFAKSKLIFFNFSVLNLIINGIPSILAADAADGADAVVVLNLIINGIPSILKECIWRRNCIQVLNLIINGIPSILHGRCKRKM